MKRALSILVLVLYLFTVSMAARAEASSWKLGQWDPGVHNVKNAVYYAWCHHRYVYCPKGHEAWGVTGCETGYTYSLWSENGQYKGIFQMGYGERRKYGHGYDPWSQASSAHAYWEDSGKDWSRWDPKCRP